MEFKNFQKNRTTTECKGTRALLLLLPPTTGVWNDMVCVISSPSIVTPLLLFSREVGNGVEFMATMNVISRARCLFLFFFLRLCVCACVFEERCVSRSAI